MKAYQVVNSIIRDAFREYEVGVVITGVLFYPLVWIMAIFAHKIYKGTWSL